MRRMTPFLLLVLASGCQKHSPFTVAVATPAATRSVYILAGQSNMLGIGQNDDYPAVNGLQIVGGPARGPGYAAGADLIAAHVAPSILLVQCSVGSTEMKRWTAGGDLYQACVNSVKANLQPGDRIVGLMFDQGEAEGFSAGYIPWGQLFTQMVNGFRRDLGVPALPVVYAQLGQTPFPYPGWDYIKQEQASSMTATVQMVTTDDQPVVEGVHHDADANLVIGRRFAEKLRAE